MYSDDHDNTEASTSSAIVAALGSGNNLSLKSSNRSPAPAPVNAKDKKSNIKIPTHHSFVLSDVKDQSLTILSEGILYLFLRFAKAVFFIFVIFFLSVTFKLDCVCFFIVVFILNHFIQLRFANLIDYI